MPTEFNKAEYDALLLTQQVLFEVTNALEHGDICGAANIVDQLETYISTRMVGLMAPEIKAVQGLFHEHS